MKLKRQYVKITNSRAVLAPNRALCVCVCVCCFFFLESRQTTQREGFDTETLGIDSPPAVRHWVYERDLHYQGIVIELYLNWTTPCIFYSLRTNGDHCIQFHYQCVHNR